MEINRRLAICYTKKITKTEGMVNEKHWKISVCTSGARGNLASISQHFTYLEIPLKTKKNFYRYLALALGACSPESGDRFYGWRMPQFLKEVV